MHRDIECMATVTSFYDLMRKIYVGTNTQLYPQFSTE